MKLQSVCKFVFLFTLSSSILPATFDTTLEALQSLSPKSTCIEDSLQDLLPSCTIDTLDSIERSYFAIKLSICEFSSAGVLFPHQCNLQSISRASIRSLSKYLQICTVQLESKPQWWTTYSGNYKFIGLLCLENQKVFETQSTILLYKNISSIYFKFFNELDFAYSEIGIKKDEMHHLNNHMIDLQNSINLFETSLSELMRGIVLQFADVSSMISKIHDSSNEISIQYDTLHDSSIQLFQRHLDLTCYLFDVEKSAESLQNMIKESNNDINELRSSQAQLSHDIDNNTKRFQQIFYLIPSLTRIPYLLLLIIFIITYLVYRPGFYLTIIYISGSLIFVYTNNTSFLILFTLAMIILSRFAPDPPRSSKSELLELYY